jgi:glycerophosphoryl diester phosphodiesterase
MPLVSENWNKLFAWQGAGPMPENEKVKLRDYVELAHTNGYRVRFWGTLDVPGAAREAIWTQLHSAGVDHINTDDLAALAEFLGSRN